MTKDDGGPALGPHDHIPISVPEMVGMRGPARTVAEAAMTARANAERLFAEATRLIIDAEAFETCARAMLAARKDDRDGR